MLEVEPRYDDRMEEREACALLKARFEAAGYRIADNVAFDEGGVRCELDGFDAAARVGYEYVTEEAGDGWDIDEAARAAFAARAKKGELSILVVDEADAPDAAALTRAADAFLAKLRTPASHEPAARQPASKPPPSPKKPTAAKSEAKKPAAKKPPAKNTRVR